MPRSKERTQMLADVVVTAVESGHYGIAYWCDIAEYDYTEDTTHSNGLMGPIIDATCEVRETGSSTAKWQKVNLNTIARGMNRICKGDLINREGNQYSWIKEANDTNDFMNMDADSADLIIQAGLFNEIVYG